MKQRRQNAGFTLIEAVMVIVITGIVAGMVAVFIKGAVDSYVDTARRAELVDGADISLRRLAREIRLALPNSLRVDCTTDTSHCYLEIIPTKDGGRYRDAGDGSTGGNILDFTDSSKTFFDFMGPTTVAANDFIVVYNLGPGYAPADAYEGGNRAQVASSYASGSILPLTSNPFATQSPPLPSPSSRFHVVPDSGPITYVCATATAGPVLRYTGYRSAGAWSAQPVSIAAGPLNTVTPSLLVNSATCVISYTAHVLQRHGILFIRLNVTDESGEQISVFQQVHVDNSP